ncbi:MAG TPA: polysaccharide deacetylase family protein [Prolixibacteraceae bacterium]|nr:polysaccharide deacetylase family protein [Prolixibacteraceae bacterium]HPR86295.1 polysaccharide deacetylase family protein [Prolixibacteraceae bacterium]
MKRSTREEYMRRVVLFVLIFWVSSSFAQKKQVCFSFDDMPVVSYGITDSVYQQQLMNKLIASLNIHQIPAIGFVNEKKLYQKDGTIIPIQLAILKNWVNSGLELGTHTFSHPDYNNVSFLEYASDILEGETISKKILAEKGKTLRYFRHPFLHTGSTKEKADSLDNFLKKHGYTVAPVTIDNDDYLFAVAYKRASVKNDTVLIRQIRTDFVEYIHKKTDYYEKQSQALFGRNIPQILLLHASLLNSDCVDLLAAMFTKNNYEFISMDKALQDEAYQTPVTDYGKWGISWIDRWTLSQGKKGYFFKDEPITPDYIKTMAE